MGGDGGSIPTRVELVKEKAKPEQKNKDQDMVGKWQHCAISGQGLVKPIMSCGLGRLYNKEAVINHLLDKSNKSHIKKLSDVVELNLTSNPSYSSDIKADSYIDHYAAPYVCPIIGLEMSGRYRFLFNWRCGCVMSERAVVEIPADTPNTCHHCDEAKSTDDIVIINGRGEDLNVLTERMMKRKQRVKQEKKAKKKTSECATDSTSNVAPAGTDVTDSVSAAQKDKKLKHKKSDNDKSKQEVTNKKLKLDTSDALKHKNELSEKNKQADTYKKLFHKNNPTKTKDQKAHWVTYNPYYN